MKSIIRNTYQFIKQHWRGLCYVELFYKGIFLIIFLPLVSLGFNLVLKLSRFSYITTENILSFSLYPPTIIVTLFLIVVLATLIQMETGSIFYYFNHVHKEDKRETVQVLFAGVKHVYFVYKERNYALPIYSLLMSIFMNIPLIVIVILQSRMPSYLFRRMTGEREMRTLLLVGICGFLLFLFRGIFTIPICVIEKKSFIEGFKQSNRSLKKITGRTIASFCVTNGLLFIIYVLIYVICVGVLILCINWFARRELAIALFLKSYDILNRYVCIFISIIGYAINHIVIFGMYANLSRDLKKDTYVEERKVFIKPKEEAIRIHQNIPSAAQNTRGLVHKTLWQIRYEKARNIAKKQWKSVGVLLICLSVVSMYGYFINTLRNGAFNVEESLLGIQITSHRGNSVEAPENTLPALQSSIHRLADVAEIDVQLTKDGVVVLMHDKSMYRTAGVKKYISNVSYYETQSYDVGKWFSPEFVGTKIPTLEEVLQMCKGKIDLNIEIKVCKKQLELVEKVVELIKKYDFERQCVITSMSYEALRAVKEKMPHLKTGYIMSLAYGDFYENKTIDFFSMKSRIIDEEIVAQAHRLGKEVYAWTVNSKAEIRRMQSIGVDNIITDRPVLVREVIFGDEKATLLQYLKLLFQ